MRLKLRALLACRLVLVAFAPLAPIGAYSQSVWTGFAFDFAKVAFADPTQDANQDRITDNVWFTRGTQQGLYNVRRESVYDAISPTDTEWATNVNNPGKEVSATNWAALEFDPWINAYGGTGSMQLPAALTSRNAVVHLITDDIYLDLRFTTWGGSGGNFSYERAVAVPPPTTTGDYNFDGIVDAADYVAWRDSVGQMVTPAGSGADGDMSGTVDGPDYEFWRAHYGELVGVPIGQAASAAAVPEPGSAITLCAGFCYVLLLFKNRRVVRCDA